MEVERISEQKTVERKGKKVKNRKWEREGEGVTGKEKNKREC